MTGNPSWGVVAGAFREPASTRGWYLHHARVHAALLLLAERPLPGPVLKTDLFEEATKTHSLAPILRGRPVFALDIDPNIVARARGRIEAALVCADVRALPFRRGTLASVVSLSTLDHFDDSREIGIALLEIRRALRPGGTAVVTLDNPENPVLTLRARLPGRLLMRTGAIAFRPGETLAPDDAARAAREAGLEVVLARPILHAPRLLVLAGLRLAARLGITPRVDRVLSALASLERLGRALAPRRSAHYTAIVARAPEKP